MNRVLSLLLSALMISNAVTAQDRLRLATTTSTENSGLLSLLHPPFEEQYNVMVDVIAVGTGKALRLAENGDVDLVMVHAPAAEQEFVESGYGVERLPVMHNDFILVGPAADSAAVNAASSLADAMTRIAQSATGFISRGDDSGTHKKEMALWQAARLSPEGVWYLSVGQGMGAVLKIADDKQAYTLTDRGTYLAFDGKIELTIAYEGAAELLNPYHVILVNPEKHLHVQTALAQKYVDYIRGEEGQRIIREFRISGEQLFVPDVISP